MIKINIDCIILIVQVHAFSGSPLDAVSIYLVIYVCMHTYMSVYDCVCMHAHVCVCAIECVIVLCV